MEIAVGRQLFILARTLAVGPFFSQFLLLVCSPVITRLYSPEEFAIIAIFMVIGAALASVACLKLDNSIIKSVSTLESAQIAGVAVKIASVLSMAILFGGVVSFNVLSCKDNISYVYLLAMYIFVGALNDVLIALALRKKMASKVTISRMVLIISSLFYQITSGLVAGVAINFLIGLIIGYMVSVAYLFGALRIRHTKRMGSGFGHVATVLRKWKNDIQYGTPSALFYTMQLNLPAAMFTLIAGGVVGGYYALIQRVVLNPIVIITNVLSQSILPWLTHSRKRESTMLLVRLSSLVSIMFLGAVIASYLWIESVFGLIFGADWQMAGIYAGLILLLLPAKILFDILASLLISENKQKILFYARAASLMTGIAVVFLMSDNSVYELYLGFSFINFFVTVVSYVSLMNVLELKHDPLAIMLLFICLCLYGVVPWVASASHVVSLDVLRLVFGLIGLGLMMYALRKLKKEYIG